jgi:hypothetical protein
MILLGDRRHHSNSDIDYAEEDDENGDYAF